MYCICVTSPECSTEPQLGAIVMDHVIPARSFQRIHRCILIPHGMPNSIVTPSMSTKNSMESVNLIHEVRMEALDGDFHDEVAKVK